MRLIHHLRDTQYPSLAFRDAYRQAPFMAVDADHSLVELQQQLFTLERQTLGGVQFSLSPTFINETRSDE